MIAWLLARSGLAVDELRGRWAGARMGGGPGHSPPPDIQLGGARSDPYLLRASVVAHGLLTAFIWVSTPKPMLPSVPPIPGCSARPDPWAVVLGFVAAAGFVLAGVGVIADQAWWAVTGIGAGAVALLLMILFFNPGCWPASPSAPGSSTPGSKPYRRPSPRPATKEAHHYPLPD